MMGRAVPPRLPLAWALALAAAGIFVPGPLASQSQLPTPEPGRALVLVKGRQPAEVDAPVRVEIAPDGRLFLVDRGKDDVLSFDVNRVWQGNLSGSLGGERFDDPLRAVADSRGRVHVAEAGTSTIWVLEGGAAVGRIGGRGKEPGRFERLADIAIDLDDHLYGLDSRGGRILIFTPDGLLAGSLSGFGGIPFREPVLIAVDRGRRIVVYDRGQEAVVAGDADGTSAWRFPIAERFGGRDELVDLAVDAAGRVYLLDRNGPAWVLDHEGRVLGSLFGRGTAPSGFRRPVGITADHGGRLLVLDQEDRRVQEFTVRIEVPISENHRLYRGVSGDGRAWRPVARTTTAGGGERWLAFDGAGYSVREPDGRSLGRVAVEPPRDGPVAAGAADGFVVIDRENRIHRVDADGAVVSEIPRRTAGGELKRPRALAARQDGVLAVYDADDDDLLLLGPDGAYLQRVGRPGRGPGEIDDAVALEFDARGGLLVLDQRGTRVQSFDAFGAFLDGAPLGVNSPRQDRPFADLAGDPFGGVWAALPDDGFVARFDDRFRLVCSVGDPQRVPRPAGIVVAGDGTAWTRGEDRDGQAVPFACDGPPPRPRTPILALVGEPPVVGLRWTANLPGAVSYVVWRGAEGQWREIARVNGGDWTIPESAYARTPTWLAIAGVDAQGRAGETSEPVADAVTPALLALRENRAADAERWLEAAIEEARGRPTIATEHLASLVRLQAQAVAAGGDFERALTIVESAGSALDRLGAEAARAGVYREAVHAAVAQGNGTLALSWLERLAASAPGGLTAVEERARSLAADGDPDAAARLLASLGGVRDPGSSRIDRAVAEIRMAQGRYREAIAGMIAAYRAADPTQRRDMDQALALLAEAAMDRIAETGGDPTAAEQVLTALREFAATLVGSDREQWEMRAAALEVKPRIRAALDLASSDFSAARDMLEAALADAGSIFVDDEIRARAALGELALAAGEQEEARRQFARILEIRPDWVPDPEEFSPTVRSFVDALRAGREGTP